MILVHFGVEIKANASSGKVASADISVGGVRLARLFPQHLGYPQSVAECLRKASAKVGSNREEVISYVRRLVKSRTEQIQRWQAQVDAATTFLEEESWRD